ncbi:(p)ppGpp synthetase, partial [archaeon]|nr:(p)ppGpp synthetase [archaeon]
MNFNELTENIKKYKSNGNIKLIEKAYLFSKKAHEGQKRKSHDDYIMHPLNVAFILSELKLDETIIASALLHDVLEDTKITFNDLKKEFGEDIANVVEGETKISKLKYGDRENYQSESIRKMLIATTKDIRVIIVKLADRLDNMRSLKHLDKERQKRISKETLEVYAPLAYRLGIWKIKWELEDLSFKFLEPKIYLEIKNSISKKRDERERDVFRIVKLIKKELHRNKVDSNVFGRPKNFYGIYNKMKRKNIPFEEIYDLQGIRVITKDVKECYEVLGILHNKWKPIPNEFDDYIANPKPNLYQSIHTVVLIDKAKVEFQIRTEKMDSVAEEGIAAHWSYKNIKSNTKFEKSLGWLKQILHLKDRKGEDFLESLKVDLFGDNIFVFT